MDHDRTEQEHHNAPFSQVTTSTAIVSPEPIPRSTSHPIEHSSPLLAFSNTPARSLPIASSSVDKDDRETPSTSSHPLPPLPGTQREMFSPGDSRMINLNAGTTLRGLDRHGSVTGPRSGVDWIVPVNDKTFREKTVGERLEPTLIKAMAEKQKYAFKAKLTGYALNAAIGLQIVLGTLTTGLSVVTTGRQTSIMTTILGGCSTIVASYLARARGSNEPELSITRVKDLEQFIRECEIFKMDHGHVLGDRHDHDLQTFRNRFEELLGNANGERRLSTPV
ncbi:hypothetical protein B0H34DRAFT_728800 [Crassisporium funariophilum]|nr:hypothetical protein B0H34DRAFT_728800 [Crassisporium funariophilum]